MKLFVCFIYMASVHSELHTFLTTYTAIRGNATAGTPEVSAAVTLDGQQIGCYDRNKSMLVPKQDWRKEIESKAQWKIDTVIIENVQRIYKNNIHALMQHFHQSDGLHVFQGMHGCWWDDETRDSHTFDHYRYDGEDFITLDMKNSKYVASAPQAKPTVEKWNNDTTQLIKLKLYYEDMCLYRMKDFAFFTKAAFMETEPTVSLLQKSPDAAVHCHVTGFHSNNTVILWRKNGESCTLVTSGETLPNEDGTFQKTVTLSVPADDWRKHQYSCVVKHMGKTFQKILTEDEIKSNQLAVTSPASALLVIFAIVAAVAVPILIVVYVLNYYFRTRIKNGLLKGYQAVKTFIEQH